MPVYSVTNSVLKPISEKKFDLERDLQKLTEQNLETVFGLTFVSGASNQEFSVRAQEQDFYIDTLAFDETQKSFVIIEYKKDKSISVIDQGFAYLSAMLNHKADFILEINEKLGKSFKKDDIDWEQSRVIFISPEFTNYQRNAINFKDLPIFLYEVRLYTNDILEYDPIKPYRTTESIGKLSKDKTIQSVSKELKVYSESDLFPKETKGRKLYLAFKNELTQANSSFIFHPTKSYIGVQVPGNWRMIVAINPRQDKLLIDFNRSEPTDFKDPKKRLIYKKNSMQYFHQHISSLTVENVDDVDYAVLLFAQAYEKFLKSNYK
ncbi:MAG TPA: hypothetical protein VLB73_05280 [Patescibacteria group bacterium]|nr:hypothetical protein [Patescibacteria group bacterium]